MLVLALLVLETILVSGYPEFRQKIPNGEHVPNPCVQNETWAGVGHLIPEGSGPRNPFGLDFFANNMVWTKSLCEKDSDGDGRANGVELGDPNCTWTIGGVVSRTTGLSHPGICEPITSHTCMQKNSWLQCHQNNFSCSAFDLPNTKTLNFTMPRTAIPQNETTYICMGFKLPNETKYHLIGQLPEIENRNMLHHMILYGCTQPLNASIMTKPETCQMGMPSCLTILGTWGPGSQGDCYPKEFGFPMGQSGFQYAVLQLHWNNPSRLSDQFDSSGMTLFYTSDLRPNDGMVFVAGQSYITIPPQQSNVTVEGSCTTECSDLLKPKTVNISSAFLHMHLLGKSGKIELIRKGNQSTILAEEKTYDYNTPKQFNFDTPIEFRAGDEIKVTCEYQSLNKTTVTKYGEGTQDEMCYGFITVYPAVVGFDTCSQWQDLPMCSMNNFSNIYSGCNIDAFSATLKPISKTCTRNCSDACDALISELNTTGCWEGQVREFIKSYWPLFANVSFAEVFDTIDNCSNITTGSSMQNSTERPQHLFSELTTHKYNTSVSYELVNQTARMKSESFSVSPAMNSTEKPKHLSNETSTQKQNSSVTSETVTQVSQMRSEAISGTLPMKNSTEKPQTNQTMSNESSTQIHNNSVTSGLGEHTTDTKQEAFTHMPDDSSTTQPEGTQNNTAVRHDCFGKKQMYIFSSAMFFLLRK